MPFSRYAPRPKSPPPFISLAHPDLFRSEMEAGGFATISLFYVRHIWTFADLGKGAYQLSPRRLTDLAVWNDC
jgi:hypothetical protein